MTRPNFTKHCLSVMIAALLTALVIGGSVNAIDPHEFDNVVDEKRYTALIKELRCPKCQNNNIADSNAPLSVDLRQQVYTMIKAGRSDQEIKTFFTDRYGDFVLYQPPLKASTLLIWFGPAICLLFGAFILFWIIRSRQAKGLVPDPDQTELDQQLSSLDKDLP